MTTPAAIPAFLADFLSREPVGADIIRDALTRSLCGIELAAGHYLRLGAVSSEPTVEPFLRWTNSVPLARLEDLNGLLNGMAARAHSDLDRLEDDMELDDPGWWYELEALLASRDDMEALLRILQWCCAGNYLLPAAKPDSIRLGEGVCCLDGHLRTFLRNLPMEPRVESDRLVLMYQLTPKAWWASPAMAERATEERAPEPELDPEWALVPAPDLTVLAGGLEVEGWLAEKFRAMASDPDPLVRLAAVEMLGTLYRPTSPEQEALENRARWEDRCPKMQVHHWLDTLSPTTAESERLEVRALKQVDDLKHLFKAIPYFGDDRERLDLTLDALTQRQHFVWLLEAAGPVMDRFELDLALKDVDHEAEEVLADIGEALLIDRNETHERIGWLAYLYRFRSSLAGKVWERFESRS